MSGVNQVTFTDKVNTRTLPIPAINKGRDVDFNELKAKHNALDNTVTDPITGLVTIVANIDTDLGTAETNITNLQSSKENTANKAVDFTVVNDVKFPTTLAVETRVPEIIADEVPTHSDQFITDPITNITRFVYKWVKKASSVPDSDIVTFDENFEVGEFNDPIYFYLDQEIITPTPIRRNEVVMFHSSNVIPSVITENPYSWVITGTYLTGTANINLLHFTYGIDGTISLVIFQKAAQNEDPSIPDLSTSLKLLLNETGTLTADFPLTDSSWFENSAFIRRGTDAIRTAIGGVYYYRLGNSGSSATRSFFEIMTLPAISITNQITVIFEMRQNPAIGGETTSDIFNNQNYSLLPGDGNFRLFTNSTGSLFYVSIDVNTTNGGDTSANQIRSDVAYTALTPNTFEIGAMTFDGTEVTIYKRISGVLTDITAFTPGDPYRQKFSGFKIDNGLTYLVNKRQDNATVRRQQDYKNIEVASIALTPTQINDRINAWPV